MGFKAGDRVRYTGKKRGYRDPGLMGRLGTTTSDSMRDGHVTVEWDDGDVFLGYPFVENLELVTEATKVSNPNYATVKELFGITALLTAYNGTLVGGRINEEVSVGNTALYDSNGEVLGYIVYSPDANQWVFYDPSFKNEV